MTTTKVEVTISNKEAMATTAEAMVVAVVGIISGKTTKQEPSQDRSVPEYRRRRRALLVGSLFRHHGVAVLYFLTATAV